MNQQIQTVLIAVAVLAVVFRLPDLRRLITGSF